MKVLPILPTADLEHAREIVGQQRWRSLQGKGVFFTGGTGFVGKWMLAVVLDAARHYGLSIRVGVLTRNPERFRRAAPHMADAPNVQLVSGDVRSFDMPAGEWDCCISAATDVASESNPLEVFDTCVTGTARTVDFAIKSKVRNLLLVSSGAVYGRQPGTLERLSEDYGGAPDPLALSSAYGEGKRAAEWLACAAADRSDLNVKIARCFAFVGPYLPLDKQFAIGNFLGDALNGRPIVIKGDGTAFRSYLHASDMAAWLWVILFSGRTGRAYNVGGEEVVAIRDLAGRVVKVLGSKSEIRVLGTPTPGKLPDRYIPDVSRALQELALPPPYVLDESIRRTARWCVENR